MNIPKGKLIAIGGAINTGDEENLTHPEKGESEEMEAGILSRMLSETNKAKTTKGSPTSRQAPLASTIEPWTQHP